MRLSWAEGSWLASTPLLYVGFDSLCSNKSSGLHYSEEKKKEKCFFKLQFKNPKYKIHGCNGTSLPPICLGLKHVSHQTEHQLSL